MPRKAPSDVTEHRITLGDYERKEIKKFIEETQVAKKDSELLKQAPLVIIAGGVGIAAYSLWRWVGLGSIIDRVTDVVDNAVQRGKDAVTFATTGDVTQTEVGGKLHNDIIKSMQLAEAKYQKRLTELQSIINDPNTAPNVKTQAQLDLESLNRAYAKVQLKYQKMLDKIGS